MQRFFFHLRSNGQLTRDSEGSEFESLDGARDEAMRSVKENVADALQKGDRFSQAVARSFEITDGEGRALLTIPFDEAVDEDDHGPRA